MPLYSGQIIFVTHFVLHFLCWLKKNSSFRKQHLLNLFFFILFIFIVFYADFFFVSCNFMCMLQQLLSSTYMQKLPAIVSIVNATIHFLHDCRHRDAVIKKKRKKEEKKKEKKEGKEKKREKKGRISHKE